MIRHKRVIGLTAVAVALIGIMTWVFSGAVWNEEEAVQFTAAKFDSIEDSTLLIGTHLIHLSALNDAIYEVAQASAEESGQENIYYKSELADGAWFDITTASSLADITTGGTPVTTDSLTGLYLTHHTKSDGKTYDLRTGEQVSLQDINDPYDLEGLDELFPLKNQYDLMQEQQSDSASGKEKMARIEQIYALDLHNDTTDEADGWLEALQRYYDVLAENDGGAEEMNTVQEVMNAVDASRRVEVYTIVEAELKTYTEELTRMEDSEDDDGETVAAEGGDSALQTAANDSYSNISDALIEYQGKLLDPGTTVASNEKYNLSQQLIVEAEADNHSACDDVVARLLALENIQNAVVNNQEVELSELDDALLPKATDAYLAKLKAGESSEYQKQKSANAAQALLSSLSRQGASEANTARTELEAYIEARCLRLTNDEGIKFIDERLEQAVGYYDEVLNDDFADVLNETVDEHIAFLQSKKRELELNAGGNEIDKLLAEKSSLQTEMMSALDKNDLTGAQEIENQIAELDAQLAELEAEQNSELAELQQQRSDLQSQIDGAGSGTDTSALEKQLNALNAEIEGVMAGMAEGTAGNLIGTLQQECSDIIGAEGNDASTIALLEDKLNTLGGMLDGNAASVFPALKELHQKMAIERDVNDDDSYNDAIDIVEEYIVNGSSAYEAALSADRSADELNELMDGVDLSALGADAQEVARITALADYADQTGSQNAASEASALANQAMAGGNACVFDNVSDSAAEYVPTTALAAVSGMRHVWSSRYQSATLARGLEYYTFSMYSDLVERDTTGEKVEYLSTPTKFKNNIYIPEDYATEQFGVQCRSIEGTGLAVVLDETTEAAAGDLLAALLTG